MAHRLDFGESANGADDRYDSYDAREPRNAVTALVDGADFQGVDRHPRDDRNGDNAVDTVLDRHEHFQGLNARIAPRHLVRDISGTPASCADTGEHERNVLPPIKRPQSVTDEVAESQTDRASANHADDQKAEYRKGVRPTRSLK